MNTGYSINWIPTGSSCCLDFSPASNVRSLISAKDRFRLNFDIKLGSPVLHKWPVSMKVFRKGWTFIFYRTATDVKTRVYSFGLPISAIAFGRKSEWDTSCFASFFRLPLQLTEINKSCQAATHTHIQSKYLSVRWCPEIKSRTEFSLASNYSVAPSASDSCRADHAAVLPLPREALKRGGHCSPMFPVF